MLRFRLFGLTASAGFLFAGLISAQEAPHYHLTRLEIPGMQGIYVRDINDAGDMVGYYLDANSVTRAFLWDASGPHDLAVPVSAGGEDVFSAATAINNEGQIVGYAQIIGDVTPGLLWNSADPTQYTLLDDDPDIFLNPLGISDNGTVVGIKGNLVTGEAFHAFVWTAQTGMVDYGTTDPSNPNINASWTGVNDAGQLIGEWNYIFSATHASVGTVGTPAVLPMSAASDAVESSANAINAEGDRVGHMNLGSGDLVPVTFAADGSATAIPGATLGLAAGQALGLNDAGTIVGRASDFSTLEFKAFVAIDGTSYDLFQQVDDTGGFDYFLTAQAVNASGAIVGLARYGDLQVGSYILTPLGDDHIFSDGFDL
jgi:probable HAF family extracellular repeat protein